MVIHRSSSRYSNGTSHMPYYYDLPYIWVVYKQWHDRDIYLYKPVFEHRAAKQLLRLCRQWTIFCNAELERCGNKPIHGQQ